MSHGEKKESTNRFLTGSRVSQQRVGSFCGNLFQNLAEVFGNISAQKPSKNGQIYNKEKQTTFNVTGHPSALLPATRQ